MSYDEYYEDECRYFDENDIGGDDFIDGNLDANIEEYENSMSDL